MGAIKTQAKQLKVSESTVRVMRRNELKTVDEYKQHRRERKAVAKMAADQKHSKSKALRGNKAKTKTQPRKK